MKKILLLMFIFPIFSWARLSVTNLAEYQVGNLPRTDPGNLSTLYNQLDLEYRQSKTTVGAWWRHSKRVAAKLV